jgi:hypothetical protein
VTPARRAFILIMLGVAVLTLALVILIRNRSLDVELLAVIGLLGGLAIVVVSLPAANGKPPG